MLDIATLQRYLPASVKNALKPYYRKLLPNQLCVLLVTFRCNYRCSYCPVVTRFDYSEIYGKADERTPEDWIAALDRLPKANVYISGGEPFLFKGLPELVNGLGKHQVLGIVTNATVKTSVYERMTRKVHLNLSFHREVRHGGRVPGEDRRAAEGRPVPSERQPGRYARERVDDPEGREAADRPRRQPAHRPVRRPGPGVRVHTGGDGGPLPLPHDRPAHPDGSPRLRRLCAQGVLGGPELHQHHAGRHGVPLRGRLRLLP